MINEHIKLSQQAKDHLVKLKRHTGIENWNVLCRWALCVSLAEKSMPSARKIPADSNVEMSWKVFGGEYEDLYAALVRQRCRQDGVEMTPENVSEQFRLHLHRGIDYLAADRSVTGVAALVSRAIEARQVASGASAAAPEATLVPLNT